MRDLPRVTPHGDLVKELDAVMARVATLEQHVSAGRVENWGQRAWGSPPCMPSSLCCSWQLHQMPAVMPTHAACVLQCALRMARDATDKHLSL